MAGPSHMAGSCPGGRAQTRQAGRTRNPTFAGWPARAALDPGGPWQRVFAHAEFISTARFAPRPIKLIARALHATSQSKPPPPTGGAQAGPRFPGPPIPHHHRHPGAGLPAPTAPTPQPSRADSPSTQGNTSHAMTQEQSLLCFLLIIPTLLVSLSSDIYLKASCFKRRLLHASNSSTTLTTSARNQVNSSCKGRAFNTAILA